MPQTHNIGGSCQALGGGTGYCSECFAEYANGDTLVFTDTFGSTPQENEMTVVCPNDAGGSNPYPSCSGFVQENAFGKACRTACASGSAFQSTCITDARSYCADNPLNWDCACLAPQPSDVVYYGQDGREEQTFSQIKTFLGTKPTLAGLDPRCVWTPCGTSFQNQMIPFWGLDCPTYNVYCSISNVNVSLKDIQAGSVSLIQQNCGTATSQKTGKPSSFLGLSKSTLELAIIVSVVVGALLLTLALISIGCRKTA